MLLKNKDKTKSNIHVQTDKGKIVLKNGFAVLTKGTTHSSFDRVSKDAIKSMYYLSKNVDFND